MPAHGLMQCHHCCVMLITSPLTEIPRHQGGMQDAGHFREVTEVALQHANCILSEEKHILSPDFPLSSFCCLVRYVHGISVESPQVQAVLQQAPCAR